MKLSFSLPKTAKPVGAAPPLKKSAAFASLGDDDDPIDAAPTLSDNKSATANKKLLAQNIESSKAARKRMEQEMKVDATVYQYDEVWDRIQEVKLKQKEAKEVDSKRRKPKYIEGLLTSAATRRLDHLRAEEKMMQREREAEGDEFADKEAFVTQAYKDQMAEVRRAEEEERQREEAEKRKQKGAPTGMAHFYRKLLEDSEQQHEETVAATGTKRVIGPRGPAPNLTITKPPELTPKSDLELAQLAKEQGKDVELNDDNQIIDKRELLSAGLNLSAPNTRRLGLQITKQTASTSEVQVHQAVGTAASRREINERRAREIRQQLEEERERVSKQKEAHEEEARQRTILKRNTQEDVQNIRARYLARKRQKLEEPVVASGDDNPVS
ncbi:coiled-coil domain-containing protein 55-domain containing protein [Suillus spraguei]|nr:coiled-coil domain-containing protein 55-domain containing protein [Suillus spraguei]